MTPRSSRIAFVWAQFAQYHVDRCEAVAEKLGERHEIYAVEVATTSQTYAWEPSGTIAGCTKVTLFPGQSFDGVGRWRLMVRQFLMLRRMDVVFLGLGYARPEQFVVALLLRLCGVRLVMMNDSKFDDLPRRISLEMLKPLAMLPYNAALVAGDRHRDYLRFLGFGRRPIAIGYDVVSVKRLQGQAGSIAPPNGPDFTDRPFVFVGRFVAKKNIPFMLSGYRLYLDLAGPDGRDLVLVGSGPLDGEIGRLISAGGLKDRVRLVGFLAAPEVARILAGGLALLLLSNEEQWGLVVNEAVALNLPVIVSENVGARDALVTNLVNGFVVEDEAVDGLARAMLALSSSRAQWEFMVTNSAARSAAGDSSRFVEAVQSLLPA